MRCKGNDDTIHDVTWQIFNKAYLPATTVCAQSLFNVPIVVIPNCSRNNGTWCEETHQCLDLHTDLNNCGECGNQCVENQDCIDGECTDILTATNLNATETFTEDTPLTLTTIEVSDIDSGVVTVIFTLSTSNVGGFNTATSGSVSASYDAGEGTWTASGPIEDVNALLTNVIFTPASNYNSDFSIDVNISDGDNTITGTKDITGVVVNDAPIASNLSAAETYVEDTALNLINIVISDVDTSTVTATLTLSAPSAGTLNHDTSGSTTATYNAGTGVWTASGPISEVNTLLAGLTFTPTANYNSNFTIATFVSDGTASVSGSKTMTGTAANDAPILDASRSPFLAGIAMDSGAPSGAVGTYIGSLIDGVTPAGGLDNVADPDGVVAIGIAVTAADSSNGTWFYSIDGGSAWNTLGAVSNSSARLLAADVNTRLYFQPNPSFTGTINPAITFRAWDQTSGSNGDTADTSTSGGSTAFSSATDTASITVS